MIVIAKVKLDIDASKEDIDEIIENMDYNFSFKKGVFDSTGAEREIELINKTEILEHEYVNSSGR